MTENEKFKIISEANAVAVGKVRNDIEVSWPKIKETFNPATDEGAFHGREGTAPPSLAFFSNAMCGCLITQIRAFAKRLEISLSPLKLLAGFPWQGENKASSLYETAPVEFDININIRSEESVRAVKKAAQDGCSIEQSPSSDFPRKHYLLSSGKRNFDDKRRIYKTSVTSV